jgi:hypothetical protein
MKTKTNMNKEVQAELKKGKKLMALQQKSAKLREEIESLDAKMIETKKKRKDVQSEIFFLLTGYRFGDKFNWGKSQYEIINSSSIWKVDGSMKSYYCSALDEFLLGRSSSPINYKSTEAGKEDA